MRRTSRAILPILAVATAVGCSRGETPKAEASAATMRPRSLLELEQQRRAALEESPLKAAQDRYEFGAVPINGGDVEHVFQVANEGSEPVSLVSVYTSCGCTTAVLEFADGSKEGPFGMPGHNLPIRLERPRRLGPGEIVKVRAIFEPAAHGPSGLGSVMRTVNLHTSDGGGIQVTFSANVVRG